VYSNVRLDRRYEELINRTRGYNEELLTLIEARIAKGILERVNKQAAEEWKTTRIHPGRVLPRMRITNHWTR